MTIKINLYLLYLCYILVYFEVVPPIDFILHFIIWCYKVLYWIMMPVLTGFILFMLVKPPARIAVKPEKLQSVISPYSLLYSLTASGMCYFIWVPCKDSHMGSLLLWGLIVGFWVRLIIIRMLKSRN